MNEQKSNYLLFPTFLAKAEKQQRVNKAVSVRFATNPGSSVHISGVVDFRSYFLSTGQVDLLQRVKSGKEINKMKKQFLEAEHRHTHTYTLRERHANKQNLLV